MIEKAVPKPNKRIVMYVPNELCNEIKSWVGENFTTLSDFGREAFRFYLGERKKEQSREQLAESCQMLNKHNRQISHDWARIDTEFWPE